MSKGYTVRAMRPHRYSPDGMFIRHVQVGDEIGVPEEMPAFVAEHFLSTGHLELIEDLIDDEPTAAELLDEAVGKKKPRKKTRARRTATTKPRERK